MRLASRALSRPSFRLVHEVIVSTLWELEDHASNKLMKSFYSQLGANSEADALRQAKLDLLRAGLSPYYWASYEIVGDSQRPLPNEMTLTEHDRNGILTKIERLVGDKFYDPSFKGHDWAALVAAHRKVILRQSEVTAFETEVNNLLRELGSSGFGLISASTRVSAKNAISATFRDVETEHGRRWVFQDVHAGGPAALAGVKSGDVLTSVNGSELVPPDKPLFAMGQTYEVAVERPMTA